jgi:hypothetical protein
LVPPDFDQSLKNDITNRQMAEPAHQQPDATGNTSSTLRVSNNQSAQNPDRRRSSGTGLARPHLSLHGSTAGRTRSPPGSDRDDNSRQRTSGANSAAPGFIDGVPGTTAGLQAALTDSAGNPQWPPLSGSAQGPAHQPGPDFSHVPPGNPSAEMLQQLASTLMAAQTASQNALFERLATLFPTAPAPESMSRSSNQPDANAAPFVPASATEPVRVLLDAPIPKEALPPNQLKIFDKAVHAFRNLYFSLRSAIAHRDKLDQLLAGFPVDLSTPIGKDYPLSIREIKGKAWKEGDPITNGPWSINATLQGPDQSLAAIADGLTAINAAAAVRHRLEMKARMSDICAAQALLCTELDRDLKGRQAALASELITFAGGNADVPLTADRQPALSAATVQKLSDALDSFEFECTKVIEILDDAKKKKLNDRRDTNANREKAELRVLQRDENDLRSLVSTIVATEQAPAMESAAEELTRLRLMSKDLDAIKKVMKITPPASSSSVKNNAPPPSSLQGAARKPTKEKAKAPRGRGTANAPSGRGGRAKGKDTRGKRGGGLGGR